MSVKTVWIEEGCIMCNACESECPDVFVVTDTSSMIRAFVREDSKENENRDDKSPLKAAFQNALEAEIKRAAAGCPVEVIKYE